MPGFGDIVQKAFYLGIGLASYAGEKAGGKLTELRSQAQKLADEMVARGEMSTEEARRFVEDMMKQAQVPGSSEEVKEEDEKRPTQPRHIEILEDDETPAPVNEAKASETKAGNMSDAEVDRLRDQVKQMQDELRRLQRDG